MPNDTDRADGLGADPTQLEDGVIIYQLEKVDQGGDVADLFEGRLYMLAEAWGYVIEEDEESDNYGDIRLPDGRYAGLRFDAFIEP